MGRNETGSTANGTRYAYIAVLVLTLACGVLLVVNHKLQTQNNQLVAQYHVLSITEGPPVGSRIPSLHGESISGQPITLDLSKRDSGTLLLVLSPTCPHCKANFHNWKNLLPLVPASQVVWVDVTGTVNAAYLASVAIPASANVIRVSAEDRARYNLFATPTTIWLQSHAVVKNEWAGELQDADIKQLRNTLTSPGA